MLTSTWTRTLPRCLCMPDRPNKDLMTQDVNDSAESRASPAPSVAELERELARAHAEFEALRATTPAKRIAHGVLTLIVASAMTATVMAFVGLAMTVARAEDMFISPPMLALFAVVFGLSTVVANRNVFVPRKGAESEHQKIYWDRGKLEKELEKARKREEEALRARAELQRVEHGGSLSIASASGGGEMELVRAGDGALSASDEDVVLDLEGSSSESESRVEVSARSSNRRLND